MVPTDSSGGDDDRSRSRLKAPDDGPRRRFAAFGVGGLKDLTASPGNAPRRRRQFRGAMPEVEGYPAPGDALTDLCQERLYDGGAGAPCDMEPRNGISVALRSVATALGPLHQRKEPHAE